MTKRIVGYEWLLTLVVAMNLTVAVMAAVDGDWMKVQDKALIALFAAGWMLASSAARTWKQIAKDREGWTS